ncbi:MAG TPA: Holliday junction branch migration protein RuvA [Candidatus Fraserbacteria bacterium]|nr:Holliday junction branch migration protein RuvA [Candidatus Fraserbacteria bacterium]
MIYYLRGRVSQISEEGIVLEQGGVGYLLHSSRVTREALAQAGPDAEVTLYTHLQVREDGLALYGFSTPQERQLFRLLLTVSGVGPKLAIAILSAATPRRLQEAVLSGEAASFRGIKGVGVKTAKRLILELKDKIAQIPLGAERAGALSGQAELALQALTASLGFSEREARRALARAQEEGEARSVAELIQRALRHAPPR